MEKGMRLFLLGAQITFFVFFCVAIYVWLQGYSYEAYVPRYVEVPEVVYKCEAPPEEGGNFVGSGKELNLAEDFSVFCG